jgi:hypothetical protein
MFEYMFQVKAGCFFRIDIGCCRAEVRHLGKPVDADKDRVAAP